MIDLFLFFCFQGRLRDGYYQTEELKEEAVFMLKLKVSGTKNDLKSFRKWLSRATKILPKYEVKDNPEFIPNSKDGKQDYHMV